jgi:hypothetical protein
MSIDDEIVQDFCGTAGQKFDLLYVNTREDLREMLDAAKAGSRRAKAVADASNDWVGVVKESIGTDRPMCCLLCDAPYTDIKGLGGFIACVDEELNVMISGCCVECDKRDWKTNAKLVVMKIQSQAGDKAVLAGEDESTTRQ